MVLRLKPMGELITFDNYLSDEQNLKGVRLLESPTLSPFGKDVNPSDQMLGKNKHPDVIINVVQSHNALWPPRITYIKSNIL